MAGTKTLRRLAAKPGDQMAIGGGEDEAAAALTGVLGILDRARVDGW